MISSTGAFRPVARASRFVALAMLGSLVIGCSKNSGTKVVSSSAKADDAGGDFPVPPPSDVPALGNVITTVNADNVQVSFDPIEGAKDYRIYVVPSADGAGGASGDAGMDGKIYRCSGDREATAVAFDGETGVAPGYVHTFGNHNVLGYARTTAEETLGYVWVTPAAGRIPVYSLGDPSPGGDNKCYDNRWDESRLKKYVTADADRQTLLKAGWRDFGVVFYAPEPGAPGTVQVSSATEPAKEIYGYDNGFDPLLYFTSAAEGTARANFTKAPVFLALASAADGTVPLMRVYYENMCGKHHDELVAGQARFEHAAHQGNTPITVVQWSGLTGPTTLAVEALNSGCPFQGHLSPVSMPPVNGHQKFVTLDDVRAADPNGEVFVGGEHDTTFRPQALARTFVQVSPKPADTTLDFHDGFDTDMDPFTEVTTPGYKVKRYQSSKYDLHFTFIDLPTMAFGRVLNEFWVTYADDAADTNGKFRMTPNQKASMSDSTFLHATMEVDLVTTGRRYPQILISDQDVPVQDNLVNGTTLVVETIKEWPGRVDIQVCDHRTWDVNNQCPHYKVDWTDFPDTGNQPPVPLVGELGGVDRRVRFEVYASSGRAYVLLDGQPVGCADLATKLPAGPVTVTYGDVLYHSGVDVPDPPYTFHNKHMMKETRRHMDELGFKSGVAAPTWDEGQDPVRVHHRTLSIHESVACVAIALLMGACAGQSGTTALHPDWAGPDAAPRQTGVHDSGTGDSAEPDVPPVLTDDERSILSLLSPTLLPPPPPDVSNRVADDARAAALGQRLFMDPAFSGQLLDGDDDGSANALGSRGDTGKVSCAGCHVPAAGFLDNRTLNEQISLAAGWNLRRTPALYDVGQARLLMWDGRHDALYNQPFGPIENPTEMNNSRLFVAEQLAARYPADYEPVFGALPDLSRAPVLTAANTGCDALDASVAHCHGKPGDHAEYDALSAVDQDAVTRVVVNLGKAIGAYERLLSCGASRFDRWVHGDSAALTNAEQRGAALFVGKAKCVTCHSGPFFSDQKFHDVGLRAATVAVVFVDTNDRGAILGLAKSLADPLSTRGVYSDGDDGRLVTPTDAMEGAFRTPMLRCATRRPSFMHTGQLGSLADVVAFFDQGGNIGGFAGKNELTPLGLTAAEERDLVLFLGALDGPGPPAALLTSP